MYVSNRVQTSYVTVAPKRRKQQQGSGQVGDEAQAQEPVSVPPHTAESATSSQGQAAPQGSSRQRGSGAGAAAAGRELRRARIVITVKRTQSYEQWLEENPLQAIISGDGDDEAEGAAESVATG